MNNEDNILKSKSYSFSLEIIKLYKKLIANKEFVLSKQLLRSGTAIGALVREAEYGQSKADFISKLSIALKEANESHYWLELLRDSSYISDQESEGYIYSVVELIKILTSIINTSKRNTIRK